MPILNGNFVKIFYTQENCRPDMNHCDWAFTYDYDEEMKNPRHLRLPAYFFSILKDPQDLIKKDINLQQIKKDRTKFCNFVYSNPIPFRNKFFKKLNRYKKVESWGKCLNNMGRSLPERLLEKGGRVTCKSKDFLEKFKFTVSAENSCYPGYLTEKIFESINANSIPIFWGNPLVYRDLNTKSFINYHEFEKKVKENISEILFKIPLVRFLTKKYLEQATFKNMIKRIIEIDNDDGLWEEYLKQPWYPDNKPTKYVDEDNIRKRLREIFG